MHSSLLAQKIKQRGEAGKKSPKPIAPPETTIKGVSLEASPLQTDRDEGEEGRVSIIPSSIFSDQPFSKHSFEGTLQGPAPKERKRWMFPPAQRHRTTALIVNVDHRSDRNLRHPHWKAVLTNICFQGIAEGFMHPMEGKN